MADARADRESKVRSCAWWSGPHWLCHHVDGRGNWVHDAKETKCRHCDGDQPPHGIVDGPANRWVGAVERSKLDLWDRHSLYVDNLDLERRVNRRGRELEAEVISRGADLAELRVKHEAVERELAEAKRLLRAAIDMSVRKHAKESFRAEELVTEADNFLQPKGPA